VNAFITGSQAYGEPTPESDIDLCVCLTMQEMYLLAGLADHAKGAGSMPDSLCFGRLNLLILEDWKFRAWKRGTDILIQRKIVSGKPCTREEAIEVLDQEEIAEKATMKETA